MNTTLTKLKTPAYVVDEQVIESNLKTINRVQQATGCKILLATKAYSCFETYPLISKYLDGTTNSSLYEARLSAETFGKETHVYSPAYKPSEYQELCQYATTVTFNSLAQLETYQPNTPTHIELGLRVNPEHNEVPNNMYSPCMPGSRFGVLTEYLTQEAVNEVAGFHIHALCQNNESSLERLMEATAKKCGHYLAQPGIKWVNFGGGHMIPSPKYNVDKLCNIITRFQNEFNVDVVLEPGEAVVLNAGILVATGLDIVHNSMNIAILDTSATAHMPDVLEMPYRPDIENSYEPNEKQYTYRLGGNTCLSGDIIGEYSFESPLSIGDTIVFKDMAQYTMVKNTHFNGIVLPQICVKNCSGVLKVVSQLGYEAFKNRLS
jgi:carboxynorspermidine decarboxylase